MDAMKLVSITRKYKKCPNCGSSWKDTKLKVELENETVRIHCECGFEKFVDENNKETIPSTNRVEYVESNNMDNITCTDHNVDLDEAHTCCECGGEMQRGFIGLCKFKSCGNQHDMETEIK